MVNASGEASTDLAVMAGVLMRIGSSEMFGPSRADFVQVREYDLAHFAVKARRAIVLKVQFNIKGSRIDPIFAFGFTFASVHMHWFITLI
jgi:hypothetical protein